MLFILQAVLGPIALDFARKTMDNELTEYANQVGNLINYIKNFLHCYMDTW